MTTNEAKKIKPGQLLYWLDRGSRALKQVRMLARIPKSVCRRYNRPPLLSVGSPTSSTPGTCGFMIGAELGDLFLPTEQQLTLAMKEFLSIPPIDNPLE